jgi:hypothetical protein
MNIEKHLALNLYWAKTLFLLTVRPLNALVLCLSVSSFPANAVSFQEITTPKTFANWYLNKTNLSRDTLYSIDMANQQIEVQEPPNDEQLLCESLKRQSGLTPNEAITASAHRILQQEIQELENRLALLSVQYLPHHPIIIALQKQLQEHQNLQNSDTQQLLQVFQNRCLCLENPLKAPIESESFPPKLPNLPTL